MGNPFGTLDMAAGYATARPAVHPRVMDLAWRDLGRTVPFQRALDIGCGAGVSTKALDGFASGSLGMEPAVAMLKWAPATASAADFVAGSAEAIPFRAHTFDLITAAGSLNYANLELFFPEAARVLTRDGVLLVYDFSPGTDEWWGRFYRRCPPPANEGRELSPEILAELDSGFHMLCHRRFEIGISLSYDFYLDYVMTETNVAAAVRRGEAHTEIRSWCAETLAPLWKGEAREMFFTGYYAWMRAGGD